MHSHSGERNDMKLQELLQFVCNLLGKLKRALLSFFCKADDAYDEYDLSLTVTGHHDGEDFAPTGKKTFNRRIKVDLGDMMVALTLLISAFSIVKIIKKLFQ